MLTLTKEQLSTPLYVDRENSVPAIQDNKQVTLREYLKILCDMTPPGKWNEASVKMSEDIRKELLKDANAGFSESDLSFILGQVQTYSSHQKFLYTTLLGFLKETPKNE